MSRETPHRRETAPAKTTAISDPGYEYMVTADGKRFLVNTAVDEPAPPMVAIFNWKPAP